MPSFELPDFYMPYPARLNPHVEGARAHSKAWAPRMGLLGPERGSAGGERWSEGRFDAVDFAHFTAMTRPDVPAHEQDPSSGP
jgi:germacradienol/geosmin synthase